MPELPEVEHGRRLAASVATGRRIVRVWCAEDSIVFEGTSPRTVRKNLVDRKVEVVHRRGKHLWMQLDRAPHPLFHFGMTGAFRTPEADPLQLEAGLRESGEWPPRFAKIHLHFDDGGELVMTNARRFGRIRFRANPLAEEPLVSLGFDPLLDLPDPAEFAALLRIRKGAVKSVLLDQGFAAGVGNWIADEVLYRAAIDPRRRACDLERRETAALRRALSEVIVRAVEADARKDCYPRTWLFHHRWGKNHAARTARGEKIEFVEIGGRTTAYVPERQR